ncbi:phage tail sheath subtilisin-like domain-containing protein [Neisseria sp. Marseille-Q5346]|uniref:phage tail sheath subtilisin-like domain-containing protein n=1 Tax=Neisseria sp. Marseille-Q5346 TaxID=2972775 RepID=UPI0021DF5AB8|nr:phage tail sheath subtilisin-like domain-containing protein [Neisseria sp. Marseille-Q5346]
MTSANVSFDKIKTSTRKPGVYVEWNTKLAVRNLPTNKQRVLLIAQHSNPKAGKLTALENIYSAADVATAYGAGSQAHLMALAAIKAYAYADLSLITVADNEAGVAATGSITITGTADTQGVLRVNIGNADTLTVGVAANATAATVAAAVKAAIDAETSLSVTATASEGLVTLTAKNKGTHGNHIRIRASNTAEGITVAVKAMSGGDADADIGPALNAVIAEGHNLIAVGCTDEANLLKLRTHLETVGAPEEKRWALGIYGQTGALAQTTTQAGRLNSGYLYSAWYRKTPSLPCELAAAFAAVVASEEDPARPLNTLKLNGIGVCDSADKTMRTEQENALYNGVTPIETSPDGTSAQIVRAISTYTKTANGTADESLLDMTTVRTLIYVSGACADRIALRFPRDKMTERTIARVRSELIDVLMKCEELEIVEDVENNLANLIVERDAQNTGMLNCRVPSDVVNGLHQVGMVIDLYL